MEAKLTFSVVQESHEGPIGDTWKYWVEAKVFNQGLQGQGKISIAKHALPSGVTQVPPGSPAAVEIPAGLCGLPVKIKLTLEATEMDMFRSDVGMTSIDVHLDLPAPGEGPLLHEREISVGVVESPGITGDTSIITVTVRLELSI